MLSVFDHDAEEEAVKCYHDGYSNDYKSVMLEHLRDYHRASLSASSEAVTTPIISFIISI